MKIRLFNLAVIMLIAVSVGLCFVSSACADAIIDGNNIIPKPQQIILKGFDLAVDSTWKIAAMISSAEDFFAARQFNQALTDEYGLSLEIVDTSYIPGTKYIVLANSVQDSYIQSLLTQRNLTPESALNEEGYLLEAFQDNMIIISSNTSKGIFYGTQTLKQLLKKDASVKAVAVKIKDWPDSKMRGLHIMGLPDGIDGTKAKLDYMASLKMNMVVFEEAAYLNLDEDDWGLGRTNRSVLKEVVNYAYQRHLEVIPGVNSIFRILQKDPNCTEGVWAKDEQFTFVSNIAEPIKPVNFTINNSGFETDANADNKPDGWIFNSDNGRSDWSWDGTTYHSGTHSVKVNVVGPNNAKTNKLISSTMDANPNAAYSLSFWAKATGLGGYSDSGEVKAGEKMKIINVEKMPNNLDVISRTIQGA